MYPGLPEFRDVKARLDPAGRLRSRLSERLKLHE
jgi:FAD/FMN-containing dehydrogenase